MLNPLFISPKRQEQVLVSEGGIKNPKHFVLRAFLVDKRFEISNLDLVKGLREVVDIMEHIEYFKRFL